MTYSLDLPADMIAELQTAARDADISAARTFGVGGDTWSVDRPSGVGTGPRTLANVGTIEALAYRERPAGLAPVAGGTPVLADTWKLIIIDDTAIDGGALSGDVVTSYDDERYVFGLASIEPWYEYSKANLERRR